MKREKEAVELLRQLVNDDFTRKVKIEINYDICSSKAETSLLIENK